MTDERGTTTGEMMAGDDLAVAFKGAMRRLASGVAVATARGDDGPTGMAATSITSLTVEPPAVLLCVNRTASLHPMLGIGGNICINLLSRDQQDVSAAFGGAVPREQRFTIGHWRDDMHGLPMLDGAQANLACTIEALTPYGTHSIAIARIDAVRLSDDIDPLIYQNGKYL